MSIPSISLSQARAIVLQSQFPELPNDGDILDRLEAQINRLSYIQIDTIHVINRAHHHVLWTRQPDYEPDHLHALQTARKSVFEYWAHAMAYLPMKDYRYYLPKMQSFHNPTTKWAQYMFEQGKHLMQPVLDRIRLEGPLSAKDFTADKKKQGPWWDWKPAKTALELLFWKGDLMIRERKKFQKVYDLTERVLPSSIDTSCPTRKQLAEFVIQSALKAYGLITEKELYRHLQQGTSRDADIQIIDNKTIKATLDQLIENKEITAVTVEKNSETIYYAYPDSLKKTRIHTAIKPLHFLSPFDNLIIIRERAKRLFDFDYTLECYVPAAKRKFGYFVLPILWGDTFVGRFDPKVDRKTKTLIINSLVFEAGFEEYADFLPKLADELKAFAQFNQCQHIMLNFSGKLKKELQQQLKKVFA